MAKTTTAELDNRVGEIETTLWGAERNGDARSGFVAESRDTMEIVRKGVSTLDGRMTKVEGKLGKILDRMSGWRTLLVASIPALIVAGFSFLAVMLTRGGTG